MVFSRLGRKPPEASPAAAPELPDDPEMIARVDSVSSMARDLREAPTKEKCLAVIDAIEDLYPEKGGDLRRQLASKARSALAEHLAWANNELEDPADRANAILHAFSKHVDDLDPEEDAETIEAANDLFAAVNPSQLGS